MVFLELAKRDSLLLSLAERGVGEVEGEGGVRWREVEGSSGPSHWSRLLPTVKAGPVILDRGNREGATNTVSWTSTYL